jgi:hypothetical protein
MIAAAVTLALFGFILRLVTDVVWRDGHKIVAALEGRSWTAEHSYRRPAIVRISRPCRAEAPVRIQVALRAAA